jgi:hypothetical protein
MYTTSNLEDVAKHFEQNAAAARHAAERAKTRSTKTSLLVEATTWQQAADFIRNVRIMPMETR